MVKIIGYGSLLSEVSARSTFGAALSNFRLARVNNFRLARVNNFRRVFALPGSIFFRHGIANMEIGGLMKSSLTLSTSENRCTRLPLFLTKRMTEPLTQLLCVLHQMTKSLLPTTFFDDNYRAFGLHTVWGWDPDSGILPCRVFLPPAYYTFTSIKQEVEEDFMINSYLGDRQTTIKDYVAKHPDIMNAVPPATLVGRYSG
ncbi:hypothetical protein Ae201684P_018401 [Aphanomyces euteiches]|nr:hypothetical protein Ae201684P_018401 [Aphanomyces euteiches]